jgi:hypothetical protein
LTNPPNIKDLEGFYKAAKLKFDNKPMCPGKHECSLVNLAEKEKECENVDPEKRKNYEKNREYLKALAEKDSEYLC